MPLEISAAASSFLLAWFSVFLMVRFKEKLPLDNPNQRSLHAHPVPRVGGMGIILGVMTAVIWLRSPGLDTMLFLAIGLAVFSLIDDIKHLPVFARLATHLVAAALFMEIYASDYLTLAGWISGVLALSWMTNLYNFMDGSDGLAGGMTAFGFCAYGVAAWLGADITIAVFCFSIAAAALGFLFFNFHPARIFLGDCGSIPLGFVSAAVGLLGYWRELWPLMFPILVFSPFIVDASVTLGKRLARREKVWQPHRKHYYQRLVRMGLNHRGTALSEYVLMAACSGSAILLLGNPEWQLPLLLGWVITYAILMRLIDLRWKQHEA